MPSLCEPVIVPPEPAVVPVPVTLNVPAAFINSMPSVPFVEETLASVTAKGVPVVVFELSI